MQALAEQLTTNRPILMTTLAALLGALPLTLFMTPVAYLALHRFTRKKRDPRYIA